MTIIITTIPHSQQRYLTVGDWQFNEDNLLITVSDMGNWKYELLIALHELVEVMLCKDRGITEDLVNKFDIDFESKRPEGNIDEPGDAQGAPYKKEHFFATSIERLMAGELNVDWRNYEEAIYNL